MLNGGIFNWQQPSISNDMMDDESSDANDIVVSRSGSSLSGDSDGSPSTISPIGLSPVYRGSPDSGSSRSDCENHPLMPSQSPCYSRPGSPWPMFARPSFKKTRSPFWTTFRVREFRWVCEICAYLLVTISVPKLLPCIGIKIHNIISSFFLSLFIFFKK